MNILTQAEIAWLAGIYEGEGSASHKKDSGRGFAVTIAMTDFDIIERIHELTGIGTVRQASHANPAHKPYKIWYAGSIEAVDFLEAIMPWLGSRRRARAEEVIDRWRNQRKQSSKGDVTCINGHSYELPNKRNANGSCRLCANAASKRYKDRKKATLVEGLEQAL